MLSNFHFFDHFSKRGTISSTIFTSDSNFLRAFCLMNKNKYIYKLNSSIFYNLNMSINYNNHNDRTNIDY